jgi:biotin carboxyl carrier protein
MKKYKLTINGQKYEAIINDYSANHAKINVNGTEYLIEIEDDATSMVPKLERTEKALPVAPQLTSSFDSKSGEVRAPLPGLVFSVLVKEGDVVKAGVPIIILEAMKMQSELASPVNGKITKIHKKEKALVQEGDLLISIELDQPIEEVKQEKPAKARRQSDKSSLDQDNIIKAPMPGTIIDVLVSVGSIVDLDASVIILEAMKMESEIHSHIAGKVKAIHVLKGAIVNEGDILIELEN